jgi:hypothetical protein
MMEGRGNQSEGDKTKGCHKIPFHREYRICSSPEGKVGRRGGAVGGNFDTRPPPRNFLIDLHAHAHLFIFSSFPTHLFISNDEYQRSPRVFSLISLIIRLTSLPPHPRETVGRLVVSTFEDGRNGQPGWEHTTQALALG